MIFPEEGTPYVVEGENSQSVGILKVKLKNLQFYQKMEYGKEKSRVKITDSEERTVDADWPSKVTFHCIIQSYIIEKRHFTGFRCFKFANLVTLPLIGIADLERFTAKIAVFLPFMLYLVLPSNQNLHLKCSTSKV